MNGAILRYLFLFLFSLILKIRHTEFQEGALVLGEKKKTTDKYVFCDKRSGVRSCIEIEIVPLSPGQNKYPGSMTMSPKSEIADSVVAI